MIFYILNKQFFNVNAYYKIDYFKSITSQITGGKKQSEIRATLFAVRGHLHCQAFTQLNSILGHIYPFIFCLSCDYTISFGKIRPG